MRARGRNKSKSAPAAPPLAPLQFAHTKVTPKSTPRAALPMVSSAPTKANHVGKMRQVVWESVQAVPAPAIGPHSVVSLSLSGPTPGPTPSPRPSSSPALAADDTRDTHMARVAACLTSRPGGSLVFPCSAAEGAYLAVGAKGRGRVLLCAAAGHAALAGARGALAAAGPGWAAGASDAVLGLAGPAAGWAVGLAALYTLAPPPDLAAAEGAAAAAAAGAGGSSTAAACPCCPIGLGCRPGEAAAARAAAAHELGLSCLIIIGAVALLQAGCGGAGGAGPGAFLLACAPALVQVRWWTVGAATAGPAALATARALATAPGLWPAAAAPLRSALLTLPGAGLSSTAATTAASTDLEATAVAFHIAGAWAAGVAVAFLLDSLRRETFTARRLATAAAAREASESLARGAAQAALAAAQAQAAGRALATARERAAHEARAQFMSLMCHEVRTPLNGCLASAELLLDTPLGPDQRELAATVRVSGSMLLATVSNCLDWFKTEAGKPLDLVRAEVGVGEVLNDVTAVVGAVLQGAPARAGAPPGVPPSSAAAATSTPPPPVRVSRPMLGPGVPAAFLGDGDRVRGVLLNLITNAAKYTRSGALAVRVSVSPGGPHHRPVPHGPDTFGGGGVGAGSPAAAPSSKDPPPAPPTPELPPSAAAVLAASSLYAPASAGQRWRDVTGPPPMPAQTFGGGGDDAPVAQPRSSTGIEAEPSVADGWHAVASRWDNGRASRASAGPDEFLVFEVCDTGVGIDRACLGALFRKFVQGVEGDGPGSARAPRRAGGTGLGLAICCTQVKAMGGQIGAASRVGAGSTFWFSVPLLRVGRGGSGEGGGVWAGEAATAAAQVAAPAASTPAAPGDAAQPALRRTASWSSPDAFSDGHLRAGISRSGPGEGTGDGPARSSTTRASPHEPGGRASGGGGGTGRASSAGRLAAAPPPGPSTSRRGSSGAVVRPPPIPAGLLAARRRHSGTTLRRTASADAIEGVATAATAAAGPAAPAAPMAPAPLPTLPAVRACGRPVAEVAAVLQGGAAAAAAAVAGAAAPPTNSPPDMSPPLSSDSVQALTNSSGGCGGSLWRTLAAPRHDAPAPGAPRQSMEIRRTALDTSMLRGRHILLAEDNLINQKVAVRMLRSLGLSVDVACDGREAVDAVLAAHSASEAAKLEGSGGVSRACAGAERARYDAILMDMSMPVLGGVAATAAIRAAGCGVPVIAMTANASDADRDACLGAGMDGHLVKPVLPGRLAEALVLVLSGRARFQDATVALGPGLGS